EERLPAELFADFGQIGADLFAEAVDDVALRAGAGGVEDDAPLDRVSLHAGELGERRERLLVFRRREREELVRSLLDVVPLGAMQGGRGRGDERSVELLSGGQLHELIGAVLRLGGATDRRAAELE